MCSYTLVCAFEHVHTDAHLTVKDWEQSKLCRTGCNSTKYFRTVSVYRIIARANEMVQRVKMLATKPEKLSSVPRN